MITTNVTSCARCGLNHEAVVFTRFDRPPPDASHYATCPEKQEPILMLVRDASSPAIGPDTPVPSYHLAYAINLGLAMYSAIKNSDTVGVTEYGEKLVRLAMRWNAPK